MSMCVLVCVFEVRLPGPLGCSDRSKRFKKPTTWQQLMSKALACPNTLLTHWWHKPYPDITLMMKSAHWRLIAESISNGGGQDKNTTRVSAQYQWLPAAANYLWSLLLHECAKTFLHFLPRLEWSTYYTWYEFLTIVCNCPPFSSS